MDDHGSLAANTPQHPFRHQWRLKSIIPIPREHDLRVGALRHRLLCLRRHWSGSILAQVCVPRRRRRVRDALHRHAAGAELAAQSVEEGRARRVSDVAGLARAARVDDRDVLADAVVDVVARLRRGAAAAAAAAGDTTAAGAATGGGRGGGSAAGSRGPGGSPGSPGTRGTDAWRLRPRARRRRGPWPLRDSPGVQRKGLGRATWWMSRRFG